MQYSAIISAPFGALGVRVIGGKLAGVDFLPATDALLPPVDGVTRELCGRLAAYLVDARAPLDLPFVAPGSVFQKKVWHAIRAIPVGQTLTYAELAARVGSGARAVANACGANPVPLIIPCHRIVSRNGLGGFMRGRDAASLNIKRWLLAHEGK